MNAIADFVKALGPSRVAAMGAVAVGLIGFFIFLAFRFSQPQMSVLYTDLPFEDSTEVVKRLEALNVDHELRQDGAVILVPKNDVLKIRMQLAEDGLPTGGSVGYEIFDKGDTLGATSFVQNINQLRAIEGELARTIRSLRQVQFARVHLVIPQRKLFSRNKVEPSASIVLKVRGTLEPAQIKAIRHLAASAVEGLQPSSISIVDERGRLLASGVPGAEGSVGVDMAEDRKLNFEARLRQQVEEIVGSVVGRQHTHVQVSAELDYRQTTQTSEIFDPEGQVVRSSVTRNENNASSQLANDGAVTVGNELPAADGADGGANGRNSETTERNEETVNYEISRTQKTEVIAAGRVKRLSVAVLVDGVYKKDDAGKPVYAPRSKAEIDQIEALVRSAVGYDKTRGDIVTVTNLRFADDEQQDLGDGAEASLFDLSRDDYFYIAELAMTLIISLFVVLFVVRPLVRRILNPEGEKHTQLITSTAASTEIDPETGEVIQRLEGPDGMGGAGAPQGSGNIPQINNKTAEQLEVARMSGEVHASAIREVGEIISNNPDNAVGIIRDWMDADAA